jgi:ribosomal protein S18 acetylase RimI-like enzyme
MSDYRVRRATIDDAEVIARHRTAMFREMGVAGGAPEAVEIATRERLRREIPSGEYVGWLAESREQPVAGAGVLLHQYYPSVSNPRGRPTAYILNVYTEPEHRRRGLARRLVEEIFDWCAVHDIPRASLHFSDSGRELYEQLGFTSTNEMRVDLGSESES